MPGFISPVPKDAPSLCQKALLQGMAPPVAGNKEVACGPVCRADQAPWFFYTRMTSQLRQKKKKKTKNLSNQTTSVNKQEVSWLKSSSSGRMGQ